MLNRKIIISNDGVTVDGIEIPGVTGADVKNINPGTSGPMEVVLILQTCEVDVQYSMRPRKAKGAC